MHKKGIPWKNGSYYSHQRFRHINEANESFSIVMTHSPRLHAVSNKRSFACRLNCNNSYCEMWLSLMQDLLYLSTEFWTSNPLVFNDNKDKKTSRYLCQAQGPSGHSQTNRSLGLH